MPSKFTKENDKMEALMELKLQLFKRKYENRAEDFARFQLAELKTIYSIRQQEILDSYRKFGDLESHQELDYELEKRAALNATDKASVVDAIIAQDEAIAAIEVLETAFGDYSISHTGSRPST